MSGFTSRPIRAVSLLTALLIFLMPAAAFAADAIDISHDKCASPGSSKVASWIGHYSKGIVGVNGGGDFEQNSCLGNEIKHFDGYYLYVNTNYPSDQCHEQPSRKAAYHCGYNLGRWDVSYADSQHAYSNVWFLDVEEGPGIPWTGDDTYNSVFLFGLGKGIQSKSNSLIGYYSTDLQWNDITGGWNGKGIDWYATGSEGKPSHDTIKSACNSNFSQGLGVGYYQFIENDLDQDNLC